MKWTNPGHQLDAFGARYLKVKNLYIYGIDDKAKKAYDTLKWLGVADEFYISFVQDITVYNTQSQHVFCEKPVVPFQTDVCDQVCSAPEECVVALPWIAQTNERDMLEKAGLANIFYLIPSHNRQDNFIQNFVCIWHMYRHGELLSHWTNFVTTLKCNLNCKYCLNFNERLKHPQNATFEDFKENIDAIFSKFDYLYSLHFTGGEPILVKELPRFIEYLADHYKDRIFEFFIITNGTIMPGENVLQAMKAINGSFLIDDYTKTVPSSKLDEIRNVLADRHIDYSTNTVEYWYDLDFENTDNSMLTDEELECYKDGCNTQLHEFADKKIYACCYQLYANRAGIGTLTSNDYIKIEDASKMEILEFRQGYTHQGYIDFCRRCRGIGNNAKKVDAAVQMPRKASAQEKGQLVRKPAVKDMVSICVPIYNTSKYLKRCIDSLLTQTYENLEIVLVDDGSTDSSGSICDAYANSDARVVVVHQENKGEAAARDRGLHTATGEYVMFIDSDDEYALNAVELLVEGIRTDGMDLAIGGYLEKKGQVEHFGTGHQKRYTVTEAASAYLKSECIYGITYILSSVNAKLFKRSIIESHHMSFDERFVIGNDMVFMCEYLKHVNALCDVFSPIYVYYKFQPEERVQGMAWYYPDGFFLFAYAADRMIKLAQPDEIEYKQLVTKHYKDFLYALVNASANIEHFQNGIMPYLDSFCSDIDVIRIGAELDLSEDVIKREESDLPIKLMSYLIVNKQFDDLLELIAVYAKERKVLPYHGDTVRRMIKLETGKIENSGGKTDAVNIGGREAQHGLPGDQINSLVAMIVRKQREIDAGAAGITAYQAENAALNTAIEAKNAELGACHTERAALKTAIEAKNAELSACQTERAALKTAIEAKNAELSACHTESAALQNEIETKNTEIETCRSEIAVHKETIGRKETEIAACKAKVEELYATTSWRVTKPLRVVRRAFIRKHR